MSDLREIFLAELKDLYDAEKQLLRALPKMATAAEHEELEAAFEDHFRETARHVQRMEEVFEAVDEPVASKQCKAMRGLVEAAEAAIEDQEGDASLICAAQKVEHYEIAAYGSLVAWARVLGEKEATWLLDETLNEEKAADKILTRLAESSINAEHNERGEKAETGAHRQPTI